MPYENNTFDLRSEEVQEIISKRPPAVVRRGGMVFLFLLLVFFSLTWFIQYPDMVKAPFRLTSLNAPKSVTTKITGKLVHLLVKENETVEKGQVLAYLESTANHESVLKLDKWIVNKIDNPEKTQLPSLGGAGFLGELQPAFQTFQTAYTQYISFSAGGFYQQKKRLLIRDLEELKQLSQNLENQKDLSAQDLALAEADFNVQKQLFEQKVVAPLELKKEESKFLAKKMPLQQIHASLINNLSAQTAKQKEILELDKIIAEQEGIFQQTLNTLKSAVDDWKMKYILVAPLTGKVYFSTFLQENQTLQLGQEVFFIATSTQKEYGEISVPQYSFGKIRAGQRVLVKFNSYPFQEFGMVEGKVDFIAEIPIRDSIFLAKVILPNGLQTHTGRKLTYKSGMTATAEIITEDKRLAQRFFYDFRKLLAR
jgi:multidrug efflux pump subunit AcrA (membrane-fusion protein)